MSHPRARPSDLGLNPLAVGLAVFQIALLLVVYVGFRQHNLSLVWGDAGPLRAMQVAIAAIVWSYYFLMPGGRREWLIAETGCAFFLALTLATILAPAQYPAVALNRPVIDSLLASSDHALGIDVTTLAAWTRAHPSLAAVLVHSYFTLIWQFTLVFPALCFLVRDRDALWEYTFNFHVCATLPVIALALFPALCPPHYFKFETLIDQSRVVRQILALRAGEMKIIQVADMDGLVSMPSFHAAGALLVTWAVRRVRWLFFTLVILNTGLVLATFMTGVHYFVDIPAAVLMVIASIWTYQRYVRPLI